MLGLVSFHQSIRDEVVREFTSCRNRRAPLSRGMLFLSHRAEPCGLGLATEGTNEA